MSEVIPDLVHMPQRLVLASQSASRRAMLDAAGVAHDACPADIDERAIEATMADVASAEVATALARAKATAVALDQPGRLVLGSDSLVVVAGRRFAKPTSRDDAASHLRWFSGREMELHSAAALMRDNQLLWQTADRAILQVRPLSEQFIQHYLDAEWPQVAGCVGVFRIEAMGVQLFEHIDGSHFTVLGMPLLPVLAALRKFGVLPT
jgi:septum formation protein